MKKKNPMIRIKFRDKGTIICSRVLNIEKGMILTDIIIDNDKKKIEIYGEYKTRKIITPKH